jgi:hypothetical protein
VRHDHAGLGGTRGCGPHAEQRAQDALLHVLHVDGAFLEILVFDGTDGGNEAIHYLFERGRRIQSLFANDRRGVFHQGGIGKNEQVCVEDAGVVLAHLARDVVLERAQLAHRVGEGLREPLRFGVHPVRIDQVARHGNPVGVAHERRSDYDTGRGGNAAALELGLRPGGTVGGAVQLCDFVA